MTHYFYGIEYVYSENACLQNSPRLAELVIEAVLKESERDFTRKQMLGETPAWRRQVAYSHWRTVLRLKRICKMWSAILECNNNIKALCIDSLKIYLIWCAEHSVKSCIRQCDGPTMILRQYMAAFENLAVIECACDCRLVAIDRLGDRDYKSCNNDLTMIVFDCEQLLKKKKHSQFLHFESMHIDLSLQKGSFIVLYKSCAFLSQCYIDLTFRANLSEN